MRDEPLTRWDRDQLQDPRRWGSLLHHRWEATVQEAEAKASRLRAELDRAYGYKMEGERDATVQAETARADAADARAERLAETVRWARWRALRDGDAVVAHLLAEVLSANGSEVER